MLEFNGDIIDNIDLFDAVCITTNGVVRNNGRLVMGAGVAKLFRDRFRDIDLLIGNKVSIYGNKCYHISDYNTDILTFPTKNDWRDDSCIIRIKLSCIELMELINNNRFEKVALPRPGCNNGGLKWEYVKKEIEGLLDDRVVIINKG